MYVSGEAPCVDSHLFFDHAPLLCVCSKKRASRRLIICFIIRHSLLFFNPTRCLADLPPHYALRVNIISLCYLHLLHTLYTCSYPTCCVAGLTLSIRLLPHLYGYFFCVRRENFSRTYILYGESKIFYSLRM